MRSFLIALLVVLGACSSFAHEGHHDLPGTVTPPNGGQIKVTPDHYFEVVSQGQNLKIFVFNHDMAPVKTSEVKLSAKVRLPKQKTETNLALSTSDSMWSGTVDAKGVHRYSLVLTTESGGKKRELKFNVEP